MENIYDRLNARFGPEAAAHGVLARIKMYNSDEELTVKCIKNLTVPAPVPLPPLKSKSDHREMPAIEITMIPEPTVEEQLPLLPASEFRAVRIAPTAEDQLEEPDEPRRAGKPFQEASTQRVLAHVLLWYAYRAACPKVMTKKELFEKMAKVFHTVYAVQPKVPTDNTLQNVLSNLRNGNIIGIPRLAVSGPRLEWRPRTDGQPGKVQEDVIEISPRDAVADKAAGLVDMVPDWCFPE